MANTTSSRPVKRRSWKARLARFGAGLVLLLVVLYFVATSAFFLKTVILPRVSKAMNANISVGDASISPFSQVILRQLKVKTTGAEPLLAADEVRLRYSLWSIIRGNIKVDEVTLDSPAIRIVQNADGTSNLDPLLKGQAKPAEKPSAKPSKPLQLDVKNVSVKNLDLRATQTFTNGGRQNIELSGVNIGLDQLKNGGSGKLTLAAAMKMDREQGGANDVLDTSGSGTIDFTLGPDLLPQKIQGKVTHQVVKGEGDFGTFAGERSELNLDLTPTEIKDFSINFFQNDKALGALHVNGPLDLQKLEGHLTLTVQSIDRQVLNLVGAGRGWDFGNSSVNATNVIDVSRKGAVVSVNGALIGRQLGIKQGDQSTPPVNLDFDYQVTVNLDDKTALLQKINLSGQQANNDLLRVSLDRPMNLTWGQDQPGFKESSLKVTVNKLNLTDWQLLAGSLPVSGTVDAQLNLLAQQDGKNLKADLTTRIADLSGQFGSNRVDHASVQAQVSATVANLKNVTVDKYSLAVSQSGQSLVDANGSASCTLPGDNLNAQLTLSASLPNLLKVVTVPQLNVSGGTIKLTTLASRKGTETSVSGNLTLSGLTGQYGDSKLQDFQTTFDFDVALKDQLAQIRRAAVAVRRGAEAGGSFDVAGSFDLAKKAGQITFNAVDLNQNAFQPFLASALAPNRLVSISLNAKGSASYDPAGSSSVKAEVKLSNFLVDDPEHKLPKTPLAASLQMDGSMQKNAVNVKQVLLTLSTADQAKNEFLLFGNYDLEKKNGEVNFSVTDFRESAFQPFVAGALSPNRLVSLSLNGKGSAAYSAQGESSVKADIKLANLVLEDPEHKFPKTPQSVGLRLDGSLRDQVLDLKQLLVSLAPTDRAKNELQLSGKLDLSKASAKPTEFKLQAESLDVTPYYDLFAGSTNAPAAQQPSPKPAPASAPAAPRTEPEPIELPLQQASFDAKIGRLYLRDIAVSNLVATAKVNSNKVALTPFQLTLNGAPVSASVSADVGVKGWTYDLNATLDRVPVDPFVNSFMPASRDQYHGFILASAQIKGAGITDASLQKNLSGELSLSLTNATIKLSQGKPPKNVFGRLIWYTLEGIGTFLHVNEIASSPLNSVYAQATIGDGKIDLSRAALQSQAFEAHTQGVIPMQVPLTNSPLNLPLEFSLSRSLAEKSGLMPANTPPDAAYAALPTFVAVKGTIGEPKSDFKELAIGGVLLKSGVGVAEKLGVNVGGKTGGILKGVGNLLTGQPPASTNAPAPANTNPPPPRFNPLNLFKKK